MLRTLRDALAPQPGTWSIDANADWTPGTARQFLACAAVPVTCGETYQVAAGRVCRPRVHDRAAVPAGRRRPEQRRFSGTAAPQASRRQSGPSGRQSSTSAPRWMCWSTPTRGRCTARNVLIHIRVGSVKTADDVPDLAPLCHGLNIKMEKAGGVRSILRGLRAVRFEMRDVMWQPLRRGRARRCGCGLDAWLAARSTVPPPHISCRWPATATLTDPCLSVPRIHAPSTQRAQVTEASSRFAGGFQWGQGTQLGCIVLPETPGIGVEPKT